METLTNAFLRQAQHYLTGDDFARVERSLALAREVHQGYFRMSGAPYVEHVIAVANILAQWRAPAEVLAAALLHDSGKPNYAHVPDPQRLKAIIGERASHIVTHVARLGRYGSSLVGPGLGENNGQSTTLPWAAIVLRQEPTAIIVKIADRIDNFRTINLLPRNRRRAFAHGVRTVFIPFAQSLGMQQAKRTLEDEAFRVLDPEHYQRVVSEYRSRPCQEAIGAAVTAMRDHLRANGIQATVQCAPVSHYQIYHHTIQTTGPSHVLPPILILVEDESACYQAMRLIHQRWQPRTGAIHDFIASPKPNGFRALQTQVKIAGDIYALVDIRDPIMHLVDEFGVTARWQGVPEHLTPDIPTFTEPPHGKIAVFTPEGDSIILPEGATPVDFAYAIHPQLGHQCSGAEINGRPAALNTELKSGDLVRILTSVTRVGPSLTWLDFVKSSRAKREIRKWHTQRSPEEARQHGEKLLDQRLRSYGYTLSAKDVLADLAQLARKMNYASLNDLYVAIGVGRRSVESVVDQFLRWQKPTSNARRPSATILSLEVHNLPHRFARCCNPLPPDPIVGYITKDNHVSIHRADCRNLRRLHPVFAAEWNTTLAQQITQIEIEAVDRSGLVRDVSQVVADFGLSMSSFHADRIEDGSARIQIVFEAIPLEAYTEIKTLLSHIPDVRSVRAVELSLPTRMARGAIVERYFINPYTLNPATGKNFVGRAKELRELVNKLRGIRPGQAVLVWGPRRIGKTSLLLQFQHNILSHADYAIAYLSLHQISGQTTTSFLLEILRAIATQTKPENPNLPRFQRMRRDPLGYFNSFIHKQLPQSTRHIVLIFDEFQFIAGLKPERVTLEDINHYFRSLIQQHVGLTIIFSGGGILSDLQRQADTVSLLEVAEYLPIKRLNDMDARELITEPAIRVSYDDAAVDRLVQMTSGHPYFLQLICSELFNYATENQLTRITLDHLETFLDLSWMIYAEHYFSHLWGDGVISDRQQLGRYKLAFLATALISPPGQWTTFDQLLRTGIPHLIPEDMLWQTLKGLQHLDSLEFQGEAFRVSIEFAQRWIQNNHSLSHLLRGLSR